MGWTEAIALAKALGAESWSDIEGLTCDRLTYRSLDEIPDLVFAACKDKIHDLARNVEAERARVANLVRLLNEQEPFSS